ncbi:MAG: FtsX-like permease family protein [Candidatus Thiodiazotropha sp.]
MLAGLAWRNLWRHPRRTLLNVISIAFASLIMVFLLSFQLGTYASMKENVLRIMDGFAQIQPLGYRDNPEIRKVIDHPEVTLKRLQAIDGVGTAAPRAESFAILSNGEKSIGAAVVGIDPQREMLVSHLYHSIRHGRYLQKDDQAAIVLGAALARNLGVGVGDSVSLLGQARDGSIAADVLSVVGIFSTGMPEIDRQFSEIPLTRFQASFGMDSAVNLIVISGPSLTGVTQALPRVRKALSDARLSVVSWQELQPGLNAAISLDLSTSMLWYVSLVIVVVFIILNTLLMAVLERTREFGVLLAVGMRPSSLGSMIWMELLLLTLLGLAVGLAVGSGITLAIGHYGLEMPGAEAIFAQWGLPGKLYPRLSLLSLSAGPGAMAICILIAGIFPYRRVRSLEPVTAMRSA